MKSASIVALLQRFPLVPIQDDDHLDAAQKVIDQLLELDCDKGRQEYLDALTDLVETYEDEHHQIPDASKSEVLRELMRSNQFSQAQLARQTGIAQSTLSSVLNGVRSLTRDQVVTLANVFGISPNAFLSRPVATPATNPTGLAGERLTPRKKRKA